MPLQGYIVDFACLEARLIVEVDGATHSSDREIAYDRKRDAVLRADGFAVLRATNDDVFNNLEGVLETVRLRLLELQPPAPHAPSPLVGRVGVGGRCRPKVDDHPRAISLCTALRIAFSEAVTMLGSMPTPWTTRPAASWIST
jgi:Protein of unknown function (DUF559)